MRLGKYVNEKKNLKQNFGNEELSLIIYRWRRWRNSVESTKTRPGADCGSDHQFLIEKLKLKLKKVGKTSRPCRYDLNQIPCDYTVKVTNRFKGFDLLGRVPEDLWVEVCNLVQEVVTKTIPKKKKCLMAKWLSEEALHTAEERRQAKSKGERERYTQLNAEFQRIARRQESLFQQSMQRNRGKQQKGKD